MAKAKKAAPKRAQVASSSNITKRKSFKRATSTPLSKAKASLGLNAYSPKIIASLANPKKRNTANATKSESIVETPKGVKRAGNSADTSSRPKKAKTKSKDTKVSPKKTNKSHNEGINTSHSPIKRRGRNLKNVQNSPSPKKAPSPVARGRKKKSPNAKLGRGTLKNNPASSKANAINDTDKSSTKNASKTKPKKTVASKARRSSRGKSAASPKRGRRVK